MSLKLVGHHSRYFCGYIYNRRNQQIEMSEKSNFLSIPAANHEFRSNSISYRECYGFPYQRLLTDLGTFQRYVLYHKERKKCPHINQ